MLGPQASPILCTRATAAHMSQAISPSAYQPSDREPTYWQRGVRPSQSAWRMSLFVSAQRQPSLAVPTLVQMGRCEASACSEETGSEMSWSAEVE